MHFDQAKIHLSRSELRALAAHASTDETRKHLNTIWFRLGGAGRPEAFASDGHRAILAPPLTTTTLVARCFGLALSEANQLLKAARARAQIMIDTDERRAEIQDEDGRCLMGVSLSASDSEDKCPPYQHLFQGAGEPTGAFLFSLSAVYLADLALVQAALDNTHVLVAAPEHNHAPTRFDIQPANGTGAPWHGAAPWQVLIMPVMCEATKAAENARLARNGKLDEAERMHDALKRGETLCTPNKEPPAAPAPSNVVRLHEPMRIAEVKPGQVVAVRVTGRRVLCKVVAVREVHGRNGRWQRRVELERCDSGARLPKLRPASALTLVRDVAPEAKAVQS